MYMPFTLAIDCTQTRVQTTANTPAPLGDAITACARECTADGRQPKRAGASPGACLRCSTAWSARRVKRCTRVRHRAARASQCQAPRSLTPRRGCSPVSCISQIRAAAACDSACVVPHPAPPPPRPLRPLRHRRRHPTARGASGKRFVAGADAVSDRRRRLRRVVPAVPNCI